MVPILTKHINSDGEKGIFSDQGVSLIPELWGRHKKHENRMDLEIIILSEVSQTETHKYMISLICGI